MPAPSFRYRPLVAKITALLLLLLAAACGSRPAPVRAVAGPAPAMPPPRPPPRGPAIHDVDPGVLRGLMIEGELRVTPDESTLAAMRTAKRNVAQVAVSVCLDVDGTPTIGIKRMSPFRAYNNAVSAALATWRFRPYVRDGVPAQACAPASFAFIDAEQLPPSTVLPPLRDALPEPMVELPANRLATDRLPPDTRQVPPTPGVALATICRRPGTRTAATSTLVQSSGDPALDRGLLEQRVVVPVTEPPGPAICTLRAAIAHIPEAVAPPDAATAVQDVPPTTLEQARISGTKMIIPSDALKWQIRKDRVVQLVVAVKVCIDRSGRVASLSMTPSGYLGYDADLLNTIATWRYRPMLVNGKPTRVCTAIQFVYRQRG